MARNGLWFGVVSPNPDGNTVDTVTVRQLKRGEDKLWRECSRGQWPPQGPEFTNDLGFRPEAHLIAERMGQVVGRIESVLNEPYSAVLTDPIVRDNENVEAIARLLISEALRMARSTSAAQIELVLESHLPYLERILALAGEFEFDRAFEKALYTCDMALLSPLSSAESLDYRSVAETGSSVAIATIGQILKAPLNRYEIGVDAESMFGELAEGCRKGAGFHPEDWLIGYRDDHPVGIVMPALTDLATHRATILFVGITPDARGRGLGFALTLKGLETIARRSPSGFIDSTDVQNGPMRRVLERIGYRLVAIQHYLRWRGPEGR